MSDFLGAVVRRAIGESGGLRPAAQQWILVANQRGRGAAPGSVKPPGELRPVDAAGPDDGGLELPPRLIDPGLEPVQPALATTSERRPTRKQRSRPAEARAGTRRASFEAPDKAGPIDEPSVEAAPLGRTPPTERARTGPAMPRRIGPPAPIEAVADAPDVVPAAAMPVEPPQAASLVRPDSRVRPLVAVARSTDGPPRGDSSRPDLDDQGPTVHVSIGRIEVRAPQPPVPRPAAAPIAPGVTLEAYLRRRDQDERR